MNERRPPGVNGGGVLLEKTVLVDGETVRNARGRKILQGNRSVVFCCQSNPPSVLLPGQDRSGKGAVGLVCDTNKKRDGLFQSDLQRLRFGMSLQVDALRGVARTTDFQPARVNGRGDLRGMARKAHLELLH
ncbi:MAG: hypothetical protein ACOYXN_00135 [Acidobacteriota bacterium]